MRRKALAPVSFIAAITASWALAVTPAAAMDGPHHWMYTDEHNVRFPDEKGGVVDFWTNGEVVQVCDRVPDSARARMTAHDVTVGQRKYTVEAIGVGACNSVRASDGSRYDLAEDHCFLFEIVLTDNGNRVPGSYASARWRNRHNSRTEC